MTKLNFSSKISLTILIALLATALLLSYTCISCGNVAQGGAITDMVDERVVEFYENEIARDSFISSMSKQKINRLCTSYNIDVNRLYCALILSDLGGMVGHHKDIDEIAKMKDKDLVSYGKTVISAYVDTLSEDEKQALKESFKEMMDKKR